MNTKPLMSMLCWSVISLFNDLEAADSLYVDASGNVGVGTSAPTRKLQVEDQENASVLVKNLSAVPAERAMFILSNTGKTRFMINNGADSWTFDNAGSRFQINKAGSGAPVEFQVYEGGDGYFGGDVYAQGVLLTSSREHKTDFAPVDGREILKQLAQLDVLTWRYKDAAETERHIGPVAEDFRDVFDMGDGTHISAVDTSGIAFAAIKSLYEEALRQSAEVAALRAENGRLAADNDALEQRLQKLEALMALEDQITSR